MTANTTIVVKSVADDKNLAMSAGSLTIQINGGADQTLDTTAKAVKVGSTVTFTKAPAAGKDLEVTATGLDAADITKDGDEYTFTMPNADVTLTVTETDKKYDVTVDPSAKATVTKDLSLIHI